MKKAICISSIILFLLIAAFPLYGMLIPNSDGDAGENRARAELPANFSPSEFEKWFNDRFAYRAHITKLYNKLTAKSGAEVINNVAIGLDGWLYYTADGSIEDIRRENHYTDSELNAICLKQQEAKDYLSSRGIGYYLMVCPDKHTVYPEYLPESLQGYEGASRFDGLCEALKSNTDVPLIDARQAVIDEKENHTVFFKIDTHWNGYGAFRGYTELINRIAEDYPTVRKITEDDCTLTITKDWTGGDMAGFIGQDDLTDELVIFTVNGSNLERLETRYAETSEDPERPVISLKNLNNTDMPTAVIFRDSFCRMMYPMLADSFSKVTFVWSTSVLKHIVDIEKPDIVIMEYVERYSGSMGQGMNTPETKLVDYRSGETLIPEQSDAIRFYVDSYNDEKQIAVMNGWAYVSARDAQACEKYIALVCGDDTVYIDTYTVQRPDVTSAFVNEEKGANLDNSGFSAYFDKSELHSGTWDAYVIIDNGVDAPLSHSLGISTTIE